MIKWRLMNRELQLIQNPKAKEGEIRMTTLVWDKKGDSEDDARCVSVLNAFIESYGGPHGRTQWLECIDVTDCIWEAAAKVWGFPRIK
jgi:hypothetical protein